MPLPARYIASILFNKRRIVVALVSAVLESLLPLPSLPNPAVVLPPTIYPWSPSSLRFVGPDQASLEHRRRPQSVRSLLVAVSRPANFLARQASHGPAASSQRSQCPLSPPLGAPGQRSRTHTYHCPLQKPPRMARRPACATATRHSLYGPGRRSRAVHAEHFLLFLQSCPASLPSFSKRPPQPLSRPPALLCVCSISLRQSTYYFPSLPRSWPSPPKMPNHVRTMFLHSLISHRVLSEQDARAMHAAVHNEVQKHAKKPNQDLNTAPSSSTAQPVRSSLEESLFDVSEATS